MRNENYMAAVSNFATGSPPKGYRSANAADFGATDPNGCFAAFATVIVRGAYQQLAVPDPQYLWGTLDPDATTTGWSLSIENNVTTPGQGAVTARIGRGAGTVVLQYNISGAGLPSFVERAMQIGLWLAADATAHLTINGVIVASDALATTYAPSQLPVACGIAPVSPVAQRSQFADIAAVGFSYNFEILSALAVSGLYGPNAFNNERAAMGGGSVFGERGLDWVHLYSARSLAQGAAGSIVKRPASTYLRTDALPNPAGYAAVPVGDWPDIGNRLTPDPDSFDSVEIVPYGPTPLVRLGDLTQGFVEGPDLIGRKNVDWYAGGAFAFA